MEKKTVGLIVFAAVLFISVFVGLSTLLPTLDQSNVVIALFTSFFNIGTVMVAVAFARNIIGFLLEYAKSEYTETFEDAKLYTTIMYYVGLTTFLSTIPVAVLPAPYGAIISGVIIVVMTVADVTRQALKTLFEK